MTEPCPCGSGSAYLTCCGTLLNGSRKAVTAEELMRSRYSAYVKRDVDYLVRTTWPAARQPTLARDIQSWMDQVVWKQLNVLAASENRVEFVADYLTEGRPAHHHERSIFNQLDGEWFYVGAE